MNAPNYNKASFLLSVAELSQLPTDVGVEVAFIGRSNAGKSSAINSITNIKGLARTSKTPGRTQMITYFTLDETRRIVDLPGYGYAKVPLPIQQRWQQTVNQYLQTRKSLRGLVLVMDVRHPLKDSDQQLIDWAVACQLPVHVLLAKADKLSRAQAIETLRSVKFMLAQHEELVTVQLFSSLKGTGAGIGDAQKQLDQWFSKDS